MSSTGFNGLDFEKQKEMANAFDRNLVELRRKIFEPSRLGGGRKAQQELDALQKKATGLLEEAREEVDHGVADNKTKFERCQEIKEWLQAARSELDRVKELRTRNKPSVFVNGIRHD